MNPFIRWVLFYICKKLVKQGFDHGYNIESYYAVMLQAAREEFIEDNDLTLIPYLRERFDTVMGKLG